MGENLFRVIPGKLDRTKTTLLLFALSALVLFLLAYGLSELRLTILHADQLLCDLRRTLERKPSDVPASSYTVTVNRNPAPLPKAASAPPFQPDERTENT